MKRILTILAISFATVQAQAAQIMLQNGQPVGCSFNGGQTWVQCCFSGAPYPNGAAVPCPAAQAAQMGSGPALVAGADQTVEYSSFKDKSKLSSVIKLKNNQVISSKSAAAIKK